ncbi:alpha/beta-hydrolase, partial [Lentinus tigrinus ALCF2SS1-7]
RQDLRACTFQQALPHLARLSEDPEFVQALTAMRTEQAELERQLWHERREIQQKHEDRVKTARTKASIIGAGLTQYEADALTDSFRAELLKFDRERVLPAWDGLVTKQQVALEALGVPAMFPSTQPPDREVRGMPAIFRDPSYLDLGLALLRRLRRIFALSEANARLMDKSRASPGVARNHKGGVARAWHTRHISLRPRTALLSCSAHARYLLLLLTLRARPAMPYVDLVSSDDYAAISYATNAPAGTVGGFDPEKPTLVILHPLFLDSTWTHPQFDDPRLNGNFNIIVFDTRTTGKSLYRPTGRHDLWVAAADLAHCFYHLRLPPAHILAPELHSWTALRFATLFPELCLSLTLCNVSPQTELKSVFDALEELAHLWCYAEDLESFETACRELVNSYAMDAHPDVIDELVAFWEVHYPPFRRTHVITNLNLVLNRTPMSADELANVRCPVLIIQAERSATHPLEHAQQLRNLLVNVPGGAQLFTVKTTHGYLTLLSASIVNQVTNKFLTRQPPARSDLKEPEMLLADRMKIALDQLAEFRDDPSISERDPASPLSFCCVTEEVRKSQEELFQIYSEGIQSALSPLAPDGRPLRKYSERKDEHWLDSSTDGFSYASAKQLTDRFLDPSKNRRREARRPTIPLENDSPLFVPSEPVTQEVQQVARIRRATVLPQSPADKHVIKGSMAKVIASGTGTSLQRRLLR